MHEYFIDSLAKAGNGMPEYIYPGERIEEKVIRQFSRICQSYLASPVIYGKNGSELEAVPPLPIRLYGCEVYSFMLRSKEKDVCANEFYINMTRCCHKKQKPGFMVWT